MKKIVFVCLLVSSFLFALGSLAQETGRGKEKHKAERITSGPVVKEATRDSAEISWSTDAPGSSVVKYGTNQNALDRTAEKPWGGTKESNGDYNHTVWVKNLKPNTTYYYKVETGQGLGTGTEADSRTGEFRTR